MVSDVKKELEEEVADGTSAQELEVCIRSHFSYFPCTWNILIFDFLIFYETFLSYQVTFIFFVKFGDSFVQ